MSIHNDLTGFIRITGCSADDQFRGEEIAELSSEYRHSVFWVCGGREQSPKYCTRMIGCLVVALFLLCYYGIGEVREEEHLVGPLLGRCGFLHRIDGSCSIDLLLWEKAGYRGLEESSGCSDVGSVQPSRPLIERVYAGAFGETGGRDVIGWSLHYPGDLPGGAECSDSGAVVESG